MSQDMFYVAEDPDQPGTAWALTKDAPEYAERVAINLEKWVSQGAKIGRYDHVTAAVMVGAWSPKKQ